MAVLIYIFYVMSRWHVTLTIPLSNCEMFKRTHRGVEFLKSLESWKIALAESILDWHQPGFNFLACTVMHVGFTWNPVL